MAVKIALIELTADLPDLELLPEEDAAFLVVTYLGRPLGDLTVRPPGKRLAAAALRGAVTDWFGPEVWTGFGQSEETPETVEPRELPLISAIMCTRDRPADAAACISHLLELDYPRLEIVVVDNAGTNGETRLAAERAGVKYVYEERPGLNFARNRGIAESRGEIAAFVDDDVMVHPGWASSLARAYRDDSIDCVTGLTLPAEMKTDAQIMFERYGSGGFRKGYRRRVFDRTTWPPVLAASKVGAGANMSFRRRMLDRIGLFAEELDCGTPARAGGDCYMFYRVLMDGFRICYDPSAIVFHRDRRTEAELRSQLYGYGVAESVVMTKILVEDRDLQVLRMWPRFFLRHLIWQALKSACGCSGVPFAMSMAELTGALTGPWNYARAKAHVRSMASALPAASEPLSPVSTPE